MPNEEFLEEYPLYRKLRVTTTPQTLNVMPKVRIKMACPVCKDDQTFSMTNEFWDAAYSAAAPSAGEVVRLVYRCQHCTDFRRVFYVKFGESGDWMMKIGQDPPWEVSTDAEIERLLGEHASLYKKGLVCESQGYGIGAFGYYRRIVEEIVDDLLDEISPLIDESERAKYDAALVQTKATIVTQEKIELVKDLLPSILRPDGMNPLSELHSALSEGLHARSDDECLELAAIVRDILVYLTHQVAASRAASKSFTAGMRRLLDRKASRSS
jgi:hypothetical protein